MVRPRLRKKQEALARIFVTLCQHSAGCGNPGNKLAPARILARHKCLESRYNGGVPLAIQDSKIDDFQIRDFQASDFDSLWSIDQEVFPPGISYSKAELKSYMRRHGSFTLVAISTSEEAASRSNLPNDKKNSSASEQNRSATVGFIVAEAGRGAGHIITIDVAARARRFGVGSLLLRGAEDRLRSAGCRIVELETAVDNVSALSFYKRYGYTIIGTFPRYYSNAVDALILRKDIQQDLQKRSSHNNPPATR